jgi:hypothetical protein
VERPACNSYVCVDVVGPIPEDACIVSKTGYVSLAAGCVSSSSSAYGAIVQDVLEIDSPAAPIRKTAHGIRNEPSRFHESDIVGSGPQRYLVASSRARGKA